VASVDEQVYPIEKNVDIENIWHLSAFQIAFMLRAADHEAMFEAARTYADTADKLDHTADTIRDGAVNLANSWRGHAARSSLGQLRQYYASARSLAANCRASAVAMNHAATALAAARYRLPFLPGGEMPSDDPTSFESLEYQKLLSDLNTAYREAITLAPNQLAINLPLSSEIDGAEWVGDKAGARRDRRTSHGGSDDIGETGHLGSPVRPAVIPPIIPPPPHAPRSQGGSRSSPEPRIAGSRNSETERHARRDDAKGGSPVPELSNRRQSRIGRSNREGGGLGSPRTQLAGVDGALDPQRPGVPLGSPSGYERVSPSSSNESVGRPPGSLLAGGSGQSQGGFLPAGHGRDSSENSERERRYYLNEDLDVWGVPEAVPSVLYGEYWPPRSCDDDDDDDDDDF
jgi:uncharacterized protein YukE